MDKNVTVKALNEIFEQLRCELESAMILSTLLGDPVKNDLIQSVLGGVSILTVFRCELVEKGIIDENSNDCLIKIVINDKVVDNLPV